MAIFAAISTSLLLATSAPAEDQPATPRYRPDVRYPTACMSAPGAEAREEQVTVAYNVDKEGRPRKARVRETTNPCFNDAALATVRSWVFEPRRVLGKAVAQEDLETTITFIFAGETEAPKVGLEDFDARPIKRVPPRYPKACMVNASSREVVIVEFDVTAKGTTENILVVESTRSCHEKAALRAVRLWRYKPKTIGGKPVARLGVQTVITFALREYGAGFVQDDVRPELRLAYRLISQRLGSDTDPNELMSKLEEIETEYGDSFTRMEAALFHQLRGGVRIGLKDYRGALDDLRISVTLGGAPKDRDALMDTIAKLEAIVAAEDARGAPQLAPQPKSTASPDAVADGEPADAPAAETD